MGATRVRQGRFGRHVVWVLLFGTLLAALALFAAWTWKAGDLARTNSNNPGPSSVDVVPYAAPEPAPVNPNPAQKAISQTNPPARRGTNPQ
jgi:hypothetical protein